MQKQWWFGIIFAFHVLLLHTNSKNNVKIIFFGNER